MNPTDKTRLLAAINQASDPHTALISASELFRWMRTHRLPTALDAAFDEAQATAQTDLEPQFIIIQVTP